MTRTEEATRVHLRAEIDALGPWFHNIDLGGIHTAPDHFLGDYPAVKWHRFAGAIPADLTGKSVLDIGCNAGFYAIEMKRRGAARVVGIDADEHYLAQARYAAQKSGQAVEFVRLSVYDVAALQERFDVVLFMGVFYHLRHPLLALDLIREHVAKDMFVFQSMQRGAKTVHPVAADYDFFDVAHFDAVDYPKMHFVEHRYANDLTNWWIPNRAGTEAMLRASGFAITDHPEEEVYICRCAEPPWGERAVYPATGNRAANTLSDEDQAS